MTHISVAGMMINFMYSDAGVGFSCNDRWFVTAVPLIPKFNLNVLHGAYYVIYSIVMKIDKILVSFTMVANDTNNKHCIYVLSSIPVLSSCLYTISSPDYLICIIIKTVYAMPKKRLFD